MPSKMKACEDYRAALIETAAASAADFEPSHELRLHLDACASCRTAFSEELQLFAAIDAGLCVTANAEVPPSFLPLVRDRVEIVADSQRRGMPSLIFAGAAVALAMTVFVAVHARHPMRHDLAKQSPLTPTREMLAPAPARGVSGSSGIEASARPHHVQLLRNSNSPRPAASSHFEVIVPPDEREALARFVATMHERTGLPLAVVTAVPDKMNGPMSVAPLLIAKLEVEPLEGVAIGVPDSTEEQY